VISSVVDAKFRSPLVRYSTGWVVGHAGRRHGRGERTVSGIDKAKNKGQELGGKAKEAVGKVTGDKDTENEGKGDQAKSNLKDAGEKIKDAFKD
jgi:uncharacterized protein YjbJ (UPF0337 family)